MAGLRQEQRRALAAALTPVAGAAVKYEKQLKLVTKQLAEAGARM